MSIEHSTVGAFLEAVAAQRPTPGGGAVAALTGALAAALGEMVLRYRTAKPPADAGQDLALREALERLSALRREALAQADADVEAFGRLSALWKLAPGDPKRGSEMAGAVAAAIAAPQRVMETAIETLKALHAVRHNAGRGLRSDLAISAILAQAAAEAAAWNVRINLPQLADKVQSARLESRTAAMLSLAAELRKAVEAACAG